eukprot:GILK01002457.1.p1 GENE.GILK01002457.1~~GILK01002457.1.p1  ORF type:complete len:149 (-),score=18.41 GILK01002457.1:111-518(-)
MAELDSGRLTEALRQQKEWAKAVIFDDQANVIASTFSATPEELRPYLTALDTRDATVGAGFDLAGEHFDVHRFHPPLVYGRRGGPEDGEGIAFCKAVRGSNGKSVFAVITYVFPTLSARAVPQLQQFVREHIESS